jgi:hypothetical protein
VFGLLEEPEEEVLVLGEEEEDNDAVGQALGLGLDGLLVVE